MSLNPGTALEVAEDVASDAKSPGAVIADALTLYRVLRALPASGSIGAKITALDKAGLLEPGVAALADLAPVLLEILKTPPQKARLLSMLGSL